MFFENTNSNRIFNNVDDEAYACAVRIQADRGFHLLLTFISRNVSIVGSLVFLVPCTLHQE